MRPVRLSDLEIEREASGLGADAEAGNLVFLGDEGHFGGI